MAFTPKTLDGQAAASKLRNRGKINPGWCLQVTWEAFGSPRSDQKFDAYPWAIDAMKGARAAGALKRGNMEDAPPGAVMYWSNVWGTWQRNGKRVYGDAGHVAIMGSDRKISTIDLPKHGYTGGVTPAQFRKAWGHLKFEGWAGGKGAFLGHTVTVYTKPKPPVSNLPKAPNQRAIVIAANARNLRDPKNPNKALPNGWLYTGPVQRAVTAFKKELGLGSGAAVDGPTWAKLKVVEDSKLGTQTIRGTQAMLKLPITGKSTYADALDRRTRKEWGWDISRATPHQLGILQKTKLNQGKI